MDKFTAGERSKVSDYGQADSFHGVMRMWRRSIGGTVYQFSHVIMPSGEIRWHVARYNGYGSDNPETGMRFACAWTPVRSYTFSPDPEEAEIIEAARDYQALSIKRDRLNVVTLLFPTVAAAAMWARQTDTENRVAFSHCHESRGEDDYGLPLAFDAVCSVKLFPRPLIRATSRAIVKGAILVESSSHEIVRSVARVGDFSHLHTLTAWSPDAGLTNRRIWVDKPGTYKPEAEFKHVLCPPA